jgi:hypothetical protein
VNASNLRRALIDAAHALAHRQTSAKDAYVVLREAQVALANLTKELKK